MTTRLTKRDLAAIEAALSAALAGGSEWENGDGAGGPPVEDLEAAYDKIIARLSPAQPHEPA